MNILLVEDDRRTLRLLERKLKEWGYHVSPAENGMEGWEKLRSAPIDIVVTDWNMPVMDGIELCRRIRGTEFNRYIYLIFVTGRDTKSDIVLGLETGADDYLTKPVDFDELRARVGIGARAVELERELAERYKTIRANFFQTIHMFAGLLEMFNEDIGSHCKRVAQLTLRLAENYPELGNEDLQNVEAAGLLHDIGMVGLPYSIASKKITEMSSDEMYLYRSHPVQGELILSEIKFLEPIAELVRSHHEQYNGRGFPDGLDDSEISIPVRILAAAVIYDELVYKWEVPLEDIPDSLYRMNGYQLDATFVRHLVKINEENIQREEEEDVCQVALDDIEEGMILASDVRRDSGALVMPIDTELTGHRIGKLKRFNELHCIDDNVYVYK